MSLLFILCMVTLLLIWLYADEPAREDTDEDTRRARRERLLQKVKDINDAEASKATSSRGRGLRKRSNRAVPATAVEFVSPDTIVSSPRHGKAIADDTQ